MKDLLQPQNPAGMEFPLREIRGSGVNEHLLVATNLADTLGGTGRFRRSVNKRIDCEVRVWYHL